MADPKKDGKKDDKKGGGEGGLPVEGEIIFGILVFIVVVFVIGPSVLMFFGYGVTTAGISTWWTNFSFSVERFFSAFLSTVIFTSVFLCLLFFIGVLYAKFKLSQIGHEQAAAKEAEEAAKASSVADDHEEAMSVLPVNLPGAMSETLFSPPPQNAKWLEIKKHMESGNQAEWRLAILEADIMLYDMLDQMGYPGDSIGDKLKQVERSSFSTLQEAWAAHLVRNRIAHEGATYVLPRGEAERAMSQFEAVFREFYFI